MLEERIYTAAELKNIIGGNSNQQMGNKLKRYGIDYRTEGRGDNCLFALQKIHDPFKVFCITELDFAAQSDFRHLRHFMFHFFCDDHFMSMPDERKERMMDNWEYHISRQTIAGYERKLQSKNYISKSSTEFKYYFAYKDRIIFTDKETYRQAWREYWIAIDKGYGLFDAIAQMRFNYGGVARKQAIYEKNAFMLQKINYFAELTGKSVEKELPEL